MGNGIPFLSYQGDPPKNDNTKVTLGLARFLGASESVSICPPQLRNLETAVAVSGI